MRYNADFTAKVHMALLVQKFGGTSVGSIERIRNVARLALETQKQGHEVVLVVSAMAGETNRLVGLAKEINASPYSREYDLLIASGEQVSAGLVSLAINTLAGEVRAKAFLGYQLGILTDSVFSKARIQAIDTQLLKKELSQGIIPVIAGFQGVDADRNITTLGRGGSDTSAVAIAAALKADDCEIYTDVDGVYTTDPRLYKGARKISHISYEEMMEFASLGAKVLQIRSVELAAKYQLPVHVRSSFDPVEGTRVVSKESLSSAMEEVLVSGVAADLAQIKFTVKNVPNRPGSIAQLFKSLSERAISVDVIVQDVADDQTLKISFTVATDDFLKTQQALSDLKLSFRSHADLAKISIVGVGMQNHPGVASKMFDLLAAADIPIFLISTSEIKISVLISKENAARAVESLHRGFGLDNLD